MLAQSNIDEVFLLYPGRYSLFSKHRYFSVNPNYGRIKVFELRNPLIIPLLYGISNPDNLLRNSKSFRKNSMENLYQQTKPEVFHIHTWMGLPREIVVFFKEKGVKMVYTSHDYYGFCSKVNFIDKTGKVCTEPNENNCLRCNTNAPSTFFLRIRNSRIVLKLKNKKLFRKLILK